MESFRKLFGGLLAFVYHRFDHVIQGYPPRLALPIPCGRSKIRDTRNDALGGSAGARRSATAPQPIDPLAT